MLEMVIAECPRCKRLFHAFEKEDAIAKYNNHECLVKVSKCRLSNLIRKILKEK